ncbi:MAG: hypothetical protein M3Y28_00460, partial [Armatimonadota bacterium]|nr:hypothetical protein [Armatimonadota bacterium]
RKALAQRATVPEAQTRMDTLAKYRYNEDLEKSASAYAGTYQQKRLLNLTTASKYDKPRPSTQQIAQKAQEETNAVTLGIETFISDHKAHLSAPAAQWLLGMVVWDLKKAEALHSLLGPEETPNATVQAFIKSILTVSTEKMPRTAEIGKLGLDNGLSAVTAKTVAEFAVDKDIDADLLRPVLERGTKIVEALLPTLKPLKKDEFVRTTEALKIGLAADLSVPDSLTLAKLVLDKGLAHESAAWMVGDGKAHLTWMLTLLGKSADKKKAQDIYEAVQSGLGAGLPFDQSEKIAYLFVGGSLGTAGVAWLLGNGKPHLNDALAFLGQKEITPRAGAVYLSLDAALKENRTFAEAKALALMRLDNRLAQDDLKWLLDAGITRLNEIRAFLEKKVPKNNLIASTFRKALDTGIEWDKTLNIVQVVLDEKLTATHRDWLIGPGKPALDTVLPYLKLHSNKSAVAVDTLSMVAGDVTVPAIIALDAHAVLGQTPTIENIKYAVEKAATLGLAQVKNILNILARPKVTQSNLTPLLDSPNRAKNIAHLDTHLTDVTDEPENLKFLTENVTLEKPRKNVPTEKVKRLDTVQAKSLIASDKALANKHLITRGVTVAQIVKAITDTALKPKTLADVTRPDATLNETTALLTWMGNPARSANLKEILETQKRPPAVAKAIQDAAMT